MNNIYKGVVAFYNVGRQYGFIKDNHTGRSYFCHNNTLMCLLFIRICSFKIPGPEP